MGLRYCRHNGIGTYPTVLYSISIQTSRPTLKYSPIQAYPLQSKTLNRSPRATVLGTWCAICGVTLNDYAKARRKKALASHKGPRPTHRLRYAPQG